MANLLILNPKPPKLYKKLKIKYLPKASRYLVKQEKIDKIMILIAEIWLDQKAVQA